MNILLLYNESYSYDLEFLKKIETLLFFFMLLIILSLLKFKSINRVDKIEKAYMVKNLIPEKRQIQKKRKNNRKSSFVFFKTFFNKNLTMPIFKTADHIELFSFLKGFKPPRKTIYFLIHLFFSL